LLRRIERLFPRNGRHFQFPDRAADVTDKLTALKPAWGPTMRPARNQPSFSLAHDAFVRIREDIVHGRLVPGEKLKPDVLHERYKIGLSPIREALSRLTSDGLAISEGQRGFFVAPVSLDELRDVANLRIKFSMIALEDSIRYGDEAWEAGIITSYYYLNKLVEQMKKDPDAYADEWELRNRAFHAALESACNSPWLLYFCEVLYDHSERYRRRFVTYSEVRPEVYREHEIIMKAALDRNAKLATETLALHIQRGAEIVGELMQQATAATLPSRTKRRTQTKGPRSASPPRAAPGKARRPAGPRRSRGD
jgi:GntR family carbon starvation induced transcriptional regulator